MNNGIEHHAHNATKSQFYCVLSFAFYLGQLNFKLLYLISRILCFFQFLCFEFKCKKMKLYIFVVYLCDIITKGEKKKFAKFEKKDQ